MTTALHCAALLAATAFACGAPPPGIRFSPDSLDGQAWPSELNERAYFRAPGIYIRNLSGLVAHVLYPKKRQGACPDSYSAADISIDQYLQPNAKLEPDTTAVERYSDKIDAKASVDASVVTFATHLGTHQAAEVLVVDTMSIIVPDSAIDIERLKNEVAHKLADDDCQPYFIRGAIVTTVTYRTATEVHGDATVSGSVFGANGKIYSAASKYSLDYRLGVTVLPVTLGRDIGAEGNPHALQGLAPAETGFPMR